VRAVVCETIGQPVSVRSVDDPAALGPGQVLIGIRAAGVNFPDFLMTIGKYQDTPPTPFTPGIEAAGEVVACGAGVSHVKPGDRVLATLGVGGFAEKAVADARRTFAIPDAMPFDVAAGFSIAYLSAYLGLVQRCRLAAGETLLVLGGAGGIGLAAIEIGVALGATVVAGARGEEKLALCAAHGASATIDYTPETLRDDLRRKTGGNGADVIFDPVGGVMFDAALKCLNPEGRIAIVGFASGSISQIAANYLLLKNCSAVGVNGASYTKGGGPIVETAIDRLFAWYRDGKIKPHISRRVSLDDAAQALRLLATRKATGKIVVCI
jgi:NADPH2:quinone reductase